MSTHRPTIYDEVIGDVPVWRVWCECGVGLDNTTSRAYAVKFAKDHVEQARLEARAARPAPPYSALLTPDEATAVDEAREDVTDGHMLDPAMGGALVAIIEALQQRMARIVADNSLPDPTWGLGDWTVLRRVDNRSRRFEAHRPTVAADPPRLLFEDAKGQAVAMFPLSAISMMYRTDSEPPTTIH